MPADGLLSGHAEDGGPRGESGADARLGVLDHQAFPRLDAERGHGLPVRRRVGLASGHLVPADGDVERVDARSARIAASTMSASRRGVVVTSAVADRLPGPR